jgi:threonine/homoserine/homoserine lactone efflux protein
MMMPAFGEFLTTALVMELTPGPNMTWLALLSARQGWQVGLLAVAGIGLGLSLLALASATGATALITAYPTLYEVIRWAGVLFLLYLAWEAWNGEALAGDPREAGARNFRRGLVVNLLNPKAATVFVVLIPAFAARSPDEIASIVVMSGVYVAIATLAHCSIVLFASQFQRLTNDPKRTAILRRIFALLLAGVAIWFALSTDQALG